MKQTNIFKSLIVLICLLSGAFEAFAYDFEVDGMYYNIDFGDSTVHVTYEKVSTFGQTRYISSYSGVITVPPTVTYNNKTYAVTKIGGHAFQDCTMLTGVTIPNSVTLIESEAFRNCTMLTNVTIPNSVTTIGGGTFQGCTMLTSVTIPNSVTFIGSSTFSGCTGLTSIQIPNSVTKITDFIFSGCTGLRSIQISNSVTTIGKSAFWGCTGLSSIMIPNSVTSIGSGAFSDCSNIISVVVEGSISVIESNTFMNCRRLKSVSLPYSTTTIQEDAFYFCEDLTDFTCLAKTPPVIKTYNTIYPGYYMATLHVPEKSVEAYKATDWWSHFIIIKGEAYEDGNTPNAPITECDTNGDGEVSIADVNRVIDAILNQ